MNIRANKKKKSLAFSHLRWKRYWWFFTRIRCFFLFCFIWSSRIEPFSNDCRKTKTKAIYSDQSRQLQTARWTNHNSQQLSETCSKRGKNQAYMARLVLVLLLIRAVFKWLSIARLSDWLKRVASLFQPMRSKTKTNRTMYAWFFPRFERVTGNC